MSAATAIVGGVLLCVVIHELGRIADALEKIAGLADRRDDRDEVRFAAEARMLGVDPLERRTGR
jgi:hypothetical protein